ncbi:YqaE/Pmp3 family membrane protein [Sphingobacterium spiritivorum]|uniref:YqaE/Pmp3 family membrane protein n=1 Tax=Sphingobacterium TaxID=28453 RepID=UPI001919D35B|nr:MULTISPECIES: YqaE/Pmp3 family membrane protein [Sphingobacterium]QQT24876.1 YqaE/Pmp3 family membrane protein [Sphingobacterium spiritivorum]
MILIAVLLPWLSFFLRGKIFSGILCLILQCTLIGWLPAAIWAVASRVDGKNEARIRSMQRNFNRSNR